MTTPADVIRIAARQIGYKESPPGSNGNKYGLWYGLNFAPWCAIWTSYCFYNAGLPLPATTSKGFAYCPYGVRWFQEQGKFDKSPRAGDVVFFDWRSDGISDHVGIVEKFNTDGTITTIEGNTSARNASDGGMVMRQVRSVRTVQGFGHPAYNGVSTSGANVPPHPSWSRYVTLTSPAATGNDVLKWQQQMTYRGWIISDEPGRFGQQSHEALKKFQREKGLKVDGVLGPMSWNAAWELAIS